MNRIIALAAAGVTTLAMAAHCQPDAATADTTIRVNGNIEVAVAGSDSTITIYENSATDGRRPILTVERDVDLDAEAKKNATVEDLLNQFGKINGQQLANDRMLLV